MQKNSTVIVKKIIGENKIVCRVTRGIPVDEVSGQIERSAVGALVNNLMRLSKTICKERVGSLLFLIKFTETILPKNIKRSYLSFQVRPYVPPPRCCYKRQSSSLNSVQRKSEVSKV